MMMFLKTISYEQRVDSNHRLPGYEPDTLSAELRCFMESPTGLEPATFGVEIQRTANCATMTDELYNPYHYINRIFF